jgi:hypothetical protein
MLAVAFCFQDSYEYNSYGASSISAFPKVTGLWCEKCLTELGFKYDKKAQKYQEKPGLEELLRGMIREEVEAAQQ